MTIVCLFSSTTSIARCVFHQNAQFFYTCRLENALFLNRFDGFPIEGDHLPGRSDHDVFSLYAVNSTLNFVPQQIFDTFPMLMSIELVDVGLRELHQPWRNCSNLANVRIERNNVQEIPGNIFVFCNVHDTISLAENQITEVDSNAFSGLHWLQNLTLNNNRVRTFHQNTFLPLHNLLFLHLDRTGLEEIHPGSFWPLKRLLSLSLSFNRFSTVRSGTFYNLPLLQTIRMQGNTKLTTLESASFGQMRNIHTIQMQDGNVTRLSADSFSQLPSLQRLELRSHRLAQIQRNFLESFPSIQHLDVRENVCIDEMFSLSSRDDRTRVQASLERCFSMFEGSPVTTQEGSRMEFNIGLLIAVGFTIKLLS